jgi:Rrf2 family protein
LTTFCFVTKIVTKMATNSQFAVAVHVLTVLAYSPCERVKSDFIAASVNTNPVVIRRLFSKLREAKLITSQTSGKGGSSLARAAEEINLWEVYQIVGDGELFSLPRQQGNQNCLVGKNIKKVLTRMQAEIEAAVQEKLAKKTLRDILNELDAENCV